MSDITMSEKVPKYSIGIDLGTTHCVLSYINLEHEGDKAVKQLFAIPQLSTLGSVTEQYQLPSFVYQAHEDEISKDQTPLPWNADNTTLVGDVARNLGLKTPIRLVSSAKSWLSHATVSPHDAILPFASPDEVEKISPVTATSQYLNHLAEAWNHAHPDSPIAEQDVTITIPASFDPAARNLTAQAAQDLNLKHLNLLEEPQAAVYSWLEACGDEWRDQVKVGDTILVIDIGGGTTDLSLISVNESEGNLTLSRVAVGEHILLGGDNMDLALAYRLKMKLMQEGKQLQPWQIQAITHACRDAKEKLLSDGDLDVMPIVIPSRGSKLIAGTMQTELTRDEVEQTILDGFFPAIAVTEMPQQTTRSALTQIGLPYAQDAAITKHIAHFLNKQHDAIESDAGDFIKPTAVLFNGGVFKSDAISSKLIGIINDWLITAGVEDEVKLLTGIDLDLAVANGACYHGYAKQGKGVRIKGGLASSYYVGVESSMPAIPGFEPPLEAVCIAPFGLEEGTNVNVATHQFGLVVGQPVKFKFFGSTVRREDVVGTHLDFWQPEDLEQLPDIEVTLDSANRNSGDVVPVSLSVTVTEVGTLKVEAIANDSDEIWEIELTVRQ
ncbi:Hsp70 family protein [Moritella yayanosii]|uniref:Nucleotide-binding protein n=1 Tax=Moritella yayanosii TaxID=69539 RepID=A0A330LL52_9GAMM|nr:Hsp70 family protein [Moritella yayanosii]SQD77433.1 Nucleotide-binding protein [Moritella yayanosii]